jgi:hypothetical protein
MLYIKNFILLDTPGKNIEIDTRGFSERFRDNKYNPYWMFRDNPSLTNKVKDLPKKYRDILIESEKKAKEEAERFGKSFDPYDDQAWRVTKAIAKTGWHKLAKPPLQYLGGQVGEMISGMAKQMGFDKKVEEIAESMGIKIKTAKDKDIMLDNSDGSMSINKEFFKNRGKFAVPKLILGMQMKMGRHLLQILGAMSSFAWCASMGPAGAILAAILISMAMKNTIKNMTVDIFKQVLGVTYSVLVYGFKGEDITKIKLVDTDGKLTTQGHKVSRIIADLESKRLPLLEVPGAIKVEDSRSSETDDFILRSSIESNVSVEKVIKDIVTNQNVNAAGVIAEEASILCNKDLSMNEENKKQNSVHLAPGYKVLHDAHSAKMDDLASLFKGISPATSQTADKNHIDNLKINSQDTSKSL